MSPSETGPTISVVIPAFNAAETLGDQLAALERQSPPFAFEVLVCDNGSTDGTQALVAEAARRDPWLTLVDASARRGAAAARNIGVARAHASLLAFCDADDVVADDWLAHLHAALRTDSFVAARIEHRLLNPRLPERMRGAEVTTVRMPPLTQYPLVAASHMGIHKAVFDEVGGFDESLTTNEDLDLSWRVQLAGHPLVACPAALVHIRHRSTLRGIYRQAYGWGRFHRQLMHKYRLVIDAHRDGGGGPTSADQVPGNHERAAAPAIAGRGRVPDLLRRLSRVPAKLARLSRSPLELAPLARDLGVAVGRLTGPLDATAPQLPADWPRTTRAPGPGR